MDYLMQARDSTDGLLYTWTSSSPDFAGAGHPGPGTAQEIALASAPITPGTIIASSQLFNIQDYGAVGDNTTNSTAAVVAAANDAKHATNGGILYVPRWNYLVDAGQIVVASGQQLTILGASGQVGGVSVLKTRTGSGPLIEVQTGGRLSIMNVALNANNLSVNALKVDQATSMNLTNVWALSATGDGIWLQNCESDQVLDNVRVTNNTGSGLVLRGCNAMKVSGLEAAINGGPGLDMMGNWFDATLDACSLVVAHCREFQNNGTAQIRVRGCEGLKIIGGGYMESGGVAHGLYAQDSHNLVVRDFKIVPGGDPGRAARLVNCRTAVLESFMCAGSGTSYDSISWNGFVPDLINCYQISNTADRFPLPVINE